MDCWNCHRPPSPDQCDHCGALQPLNPQATSFEVLGVPRTYALDPRALEERFREQSKRFHPDRFAQKGAKERRFALDWTTALTGAYRNLKDPLRRASYLLKLEGLDVEKASGAAALPAGFMEEVLELREALHDAKASGDLAQARGLVKQVEERKAKLEEGLRAAFQLFEQRREREALHQAAALTGALKYHERFLEEAEAIEMEALERAGH